jgi:hypothetical protein
MTLVKKESVETNNGFTNVIQMPKRKANK